MNFVFRIYQRQIARFMPIALAGVLVTAAVTHAQTPAWDWVATGQLTKTPVFGGITTYGIALDKTNNVFFGGLIADTSIVGPNTLGSAGGSDIFLAKTNSLGAIQWSKRYGTANADQIIDMITDTAGNLYAQVYFGSPSFTMDGQTVSSLIFGVCIAKFDASGLCTRARTPQNIAISVGGLAYSPSGFMAAVNNTVLSKINMNCDTIWTRTIPTGLNAQELYYDVTIDKDGNIIACGVFGGTVNFGTFTLITPSTADLDDFVVKYDPNGTVLWAKQFGTRSPNDEYAYSVAADQGGYVYVTGNYRSKFGIGTDTLTNNAGAFPTAYLLKFSPSGTYRWGLNCPSTNQNFGRQVVCDANNNLWLAFNPSGTFTFAGQDHIPSTLSGTMLVSIDTAGTFRARLKPDGLGLSDPKRLILNSTATALYVGGYHIASAPTSISFGATTITTSGCFVAKGTPGVSTDANEAGQTPETFVLEQNYPNPFNPTTMISYSLTQRTPVQLEIYNVTGQLVRTLVDRMQAAGSYELEWDGCDAQGADVASGIYFYRLATPESRQTRKMMLIR